MKCGWWWWWWWWWRCYGDGEESILPFYRDRMLPTDLDMKIRAALKEVSFLLPRPLSVPPFLSSLSLPIPPLPSVFFTLVPLFTLSFHFLVLSPLSLSSVHPLFHCFLPLSSLLPSPPICSPHLSTHSRPLLLQGKHPIAVVATSGTTVVGAFDPLKEIADVCERHGIWLHIDVSGMF